MPNFSSSLQRLLVRCSSLIPSLKVEFPLSFPYLLFLCGSHSDVEISTAARLPLLYRGSLLLVALCFLSLTYTSDLSCNRFLSSGEEYSIGKTGASLSRKRRATSWTSMTMGMTAAGSSTRQAMEREHTAWKAEASVDQRADPPDERANSDAGSSDHQERRERLIRLFGSRREEQPLCEEAVTKKTEAVKKSKKKREERTTRREGASATRLAQSKGDQLPASRRALDPAIIAKSSSSPAASSSTLMASHCYPPAGSVCSRETSKSVAFSLESQNRKALMVRAKRKTLRLSVSIVVTFVICK